MITPPQNTFTNEFNALELYAERILSGSILTWRPPRSPISVGRTGLDRGEFHGVVIDRQGQFQAELFIIPPETQIIHMHTHPHIDSLEFSIGGNFTFVVEGRNYTSDWDARPIGQRSYIAPVPPTTPHGGIFYGEGGSFLSIQQWKEGVQPGTVTDSFYYMDPAKRVPSHNTSDESVERSGAGGGTTERDVF